MIKPFQFLIILILFGIKAKSQTTNDSALVVTTFKELIGLCKNVDFSDPKTTEIGTFYKVAPYIIYRGEDKDRSWKDFANYDNEVEKNGVNNICYRINQSVNQDTNYKILKYSTKIEKEGNWHVLEVSYIRKGIEKKSYFAFLRVKGRFGLGDID